MLLTDSMARTAAGGGEDDAEAALMELRSVAARKPRNEAARRRSRSVFLPAIARRDLLLGGVLGRGLLDHLAHHLAVAGHERRHLLEAVAGPLLEFDHARALVVGATGLDRREKARRADFLVPRPGEGQVVATPSRS